MDENTLFKSEVHLEGNDEVGKTIKFNIIHNMPDVPGLRIEDAVENWIPRTDKYTANSFCEYVNSKNTGFICMTEGAYENMKKVYDVPEEENDDGNS